MHSHINPNSNAVHSTRGGFGVCASAESPVISHAAKTTPTNAAMTCDVLIIGGEYNG